MTSAVILSIVGLSLLFISFLSSYILRKKAGENFSLLNHYPYELFSFQSTKKYRLWFALFCLGLLLISLSSIGLSTKSEGISYPFGAILLMIPFLLFIPLSFVTLYLERWHVALFIAFALSSILLDTSFMIFLLTNVDANQLVLPTVCAYIFLGVALIKAALLLNPKIFSYAKMNKKEDGSLVRPRLVMMAFDEWVILALDIVSLILVMLSLG